MFRFVLTDDWWNEANMSAFVRKTRSYKAASSPRGQPIFEVAIEDVGPVRRQYLQGCTETEHKTAKERVLRLLRGFSANDAIPAVEVVEAPSGSGYRYELTHGAHRFYCSLAAGVTHIPAVKGFDWNG